MELVCERLPFSELRKGVTDVEESIIYAIKRTRDGAAHASENLVSSYEGVKELAVVKRECLRILGNQQKVARFGS